MKKDQKRVFKSKNGILIYADLQASYKIIKK